VLFAVVGDELRNGFPAEYLVNNVGNRIGLRERRRRRRRPGPGGRNRKVRGYGRTTRKHDPAPRGTRRSCLLKGEPLKRNWSGLLSASSFPPWHSL
jgi:hypothetical protein